MVVWAESEKVALRKVADTHKKLKIYDAPVRAVMKSFKVEEYFVARDSDVFVCYPSDMHKAEDVRIISVPHSVADVEKYVMDRLAGIESNEDYFIEHVNDKGINMSFNERFYCDDKGWIFDCTPPLDVREDIKIKSLEENTSINRYLDKFWLEKVHSFFDNEEYRDLFIEYIMTNAEPDIFDEGFYFYVCKRLMEIGDWVKYEDIRKVDIVA